MLFQGGRLKAYCLIRPQPWYRRDAFVAGLEASGIPVSTNPPSALGRDTLLVIWNRYANDHALAERVEKAGGRVLVAENGYVGPGGSTPKFEAFGTGAEKSFYYALAEGYHNGGGRWPSGDGSRWKALGINLKPWRTEGSHLLICPNRSFGVPERMMHPDWAAHTEARLRKQTSRPIIVRVHPGNKKPARSLREDLRGCWAVYVWYSSAGIHALIEGVPVFCSSPHWILRDAASQGTPDAPTLPDRLPALERMAWSQWNVEEISKGEPFKKFLELWQ